MARGHLPIWIPSITKYETNCLDTRMPKGQVLNMYNTVSAAPRGPHQLPVRRLWSNLDCNTKGRNLIIIRWLYFLRGLMSARIAAAIKTRAATALCRNIGSGNLDRCCEASIGHQPIFDILLQFQQFLREIIFNGNRPLLQKGHTEEIYDAKINKGHSIYCN